MRAVVEVAERHGCWVLSDEVYRDAVREGPRDPDLLGPPRPRAGHVGPQQGVRHARPAHRLGGGARAAHRGAVGAADYTTISPAALSDALATAALQPVRRERILARTRKLLRENYAVLDEWLSRRAAALSMVPPQAGAIALVRQRLPLTSTALAERLLREHSVLVVPGEQFGMEGFLRLGFGYDRGQLEQRPGARGRLLRHPVGLRKRRAAVLPTAVGAAGSPVRRVQAARRPVLSAMSVRLSFILKRTISISQ